MPDLNSELRKVKAFELFSLTTEIIEQGGTAWITVTGMSMYPFLKEGRDSVELSKADFLQLKKGAIVLIRRVNGDFVLHRILKVEKNCFYMIGDAQQWVEGPLLPNQLFAVVRKIKRNGRVISCDNLKLRFCVFTWLHVIPLRGILLKIFRFVNKLCIF